MGLGGGSVIRFAPRRLIGPVAQQCLIRVLPLLGMRADVVFAIDHLPALRVDNDVMGHVVGVPFMLLAAAVTGCGDGFFGVEFGCDRPRG